MPIPRAALFGLVVSALVLLASIVMFFLYKDPMLLVFAIVLLGMMWGVLFIVHVLRHGIPVRVVEDEKRER